MPPSLRRVPWGGFPDFGGTTRRSDFLPALPPAGSPRFAVSSTFTRRYRSDASCFAPPLVEAQTCGDLEIGVRLPGPLASRRRRRQGLPRSWGSFVRVRRVLGPRPDLDARPIAASRCCPRTQPCAMAPALSLSRFDGRLSRSLCTLRRVGLPTATQHSVPVAGRALPDGIRTRKDPLLGFGMTHVTASSSSSLRGARSM